MRLAAAFLALAFAVSAAPAAAADDDRLQQLIEAFSSLCVAGDPSLAESAERARAAGWQRAPDDANAQALPPALRPVVMFRPNLILVLIPPTAEVAMDTCEVGSNFQRDLPLEALAAAGAERLGLGAPLQERFGPNIVAVWRPSPGLILRAIPPSSGDGPRTHLFMAQRAVPGETQ